MSTHKIIHQFDKFQLIIIDDIDQFTIKYIDLDTFKIYENICEKCSNMFIEEHFMKTFFDDAFNEKIIINKVIDDNDNLTIISLIDSNNSDNIKLYLNLTLIYTSSTNKENYLIDSFNCQIKQLENQMNQLKNQNNQLKNQNEQLEIQMNQLKNQNEQLNYLINNDLQMFLYAYI